MILKVQSYFLPLSKKDIINNQIINPKSKRPTMKLHHISLLALTALAIPHASAATWDKTPGGIKAQIDSIEIEINYYTPSTVRVVKKPINKANTDPSLSVIATPEKMSLNVKKTGDKVDISSSRLRSSLNLANGEISFFTNEGKKLLAEKDNAILIPVKDAGAPALKVKQGFGLDPDEAIYGLGNLENGRLSQRGESRVLMPGNVEDGIPVIQSVKGWGMIWDNYSPTLFSDTPDLTFFESEVGQGVDYYFMYGGNADGVTSQIRHLTGKVPMFPLWTYGFWQSRERYKSQQEITEVVRRHRELGVPLDGIIQDWQYWGDNYLWNAMEFMNPEFNNPQAMIDEIHDNNAHTIISIWSSFGPQTKPYRQLDERGLLFNFVTWPESGISHIWPPRKDYPSGVRVYDAYSPEARDIYWQNLSRLHAMGIDGWWMDSTEPDHVDPKPEDFDTPTYLGSFRKVRNAYPLMTVGGVYDHQRDADTTKRVFILTRSGYTGQQRYGCNVWTGDVTSTWDNLRRQVPAALNFSLTGNPHVNSDIGGFFCGDYNKTYADNSATRNPLYQELYVRWLQFGLFTPMMRSHGTDAFREIYQFGKKGEPVYDAIAEAIKLRYRLLPYIYSTSWDVSDNGSSFMRALMMDFPADKNVHNRGDEFMFGRQLLAAPILEAKYTPEQTSAKDENSGWNRTSANSGNTIQNVDFRAPKEADVYLPAGTKWWDFHTNRCLEGGNSINIQSDIFTIPLYVKAGSILPLGPDVQYASEKPWDNLEIIVYPGADGEFTLYEDEGDNYNYEKGLYSTIRFYWDEAHHTLTIADRKGSFPGMLKERTFTIRSAANDKTAKTIKYNGRKTRVKL